MLKALSVRTYTALAAFLFILWFPKDWEDQAQVWAVWARWLAVLDREILLTIFSASLLVWLIWTDVRPIFRERWGKYSHRHRQILEEISDPLSKVEQIATQRFNVLAPPMEDARKRTYHVLYIEKLRVERLINQIAYDRATVDTIRDYLQLCSIILDEEFLGGDTREEQTLLEKLRGPVFQALHEGKRTSRDALPLADWMLAGEDHRSRRGSRAMLKALEGK